MLSILKTISVLVVIVVLAVCINIIADDDVDSEPGILGLAMFTPVLIYLLMG